MEILIVLIIILGLVFSSPKMKGYRGERAVEKQLNKLDKNRYRIINDLMVTTKYGSSQIDHIVVSTTGVFVIETKNYKGWIIGNENDDYWKQVIYKRKEKLRNPIKQNYGHIMSIKDKLNLDKDIRVNSIIVFTNRATLKVNTKTPVIYVNDLVRYIERYNERVFSEYEVNDIYNKLLINNIQSNEIRKEHVKNVKKNIKEKQVNIKNNICPKCGNALVMRRGKYGAFMGCSNFPKCRFTAK